MRPAHESPLCSKCKQLARGQLTEIKRNDNQPWGDHVRRWWLINTPDVSTEESSGTLGRKVLSNISVIMQHVRSSRAEAPEISCSISEAVNPLIHHDANSLLAPFDCRLCNGRSLKMHYYTEENTAECAYCIVLVKEKWPFPGGRIVKIVFVYVTEELSYRARASVCLDVFDKEELCFPDTRSQVSLKPKVITDIKNWLHECSHGQDHEICRQSLSNAPNEVARLPSRLAKIEDLNGMMRIRIQEQYQFSRDSDGFVQYATLSYTWGGQESPWMLTKESYDQSCRGISVDVLPITFQDGIRVVLSLGLSYIWIDALCIIQHSEPDWTHEAPRMAAIYSHSALNIAATHSLDVNTGLFVQQYYFARGTIGISWDNTDIPRRRWAIDGSRHWDKHSTSPLNRRGWTYQETLLSPRILHFAADQVWMQCRKCIWSETKTLSMYEAYKAIMVERSPNIAYPPFVALDSKDWVILVRHFTHRSLTVRTDRLVAISGVAETYSNRHGLPPYSYKAGVWESDAVDSLLWRADWSQEDRERITPYVAPTWSWASVYTRTHILWDRLHSRQVLNNSKFEITGISTTLTSSSPSASPFGPVKDGHLDVRTLIHPITVDHSEGDQTHSLALKIGHDDCLQSTYLSDDLLSYSKYEVAFTLYFDEEAVARQPKPFQAFLIPVRRSVENTRGEMYGDILESLILQKIEQKGVYVRIGLCRVGSTTSFSELPWWWAQGSSIGYDMLSGQYDDGTYKLKII